MASVPFVFICDKKSGFVMDPTEHKRVGYATALAGFGLEQPLSADLTVTHPLTRASTPVVGVIEKFEWEGGVGEPLQFDMYLSQENAFHLKALQQATLANTKVSALDFIIIGYDLETKQWFTQAAPQQPPLSGIVTGKENSELNVDLTPIPVEGIDVHVYKVSVQISPAADRAFPLTFANSFAKPVIKNWGLVTGTLTAPAAPVEGVS